MRGQVEKMGATFGGLEAIPPNEAARRPFNGNRGARDRQERHHIVVLLRIS